MDEKNKIKEGSILTEQQRQDLQDTANFELIRNNRWRPWEVYKKIVGSLDTTTQNIDSDELDPGWVYVLTNLCALETGAKATTVALGYLRTEKFYIMHKETPATNNDGVSYIGQLILIPGDKIRGEFKGATEGDTVELFGNGYKIKR